jgi:hypothetical protein
MVWSGLMWLIKAYRLKKAGCKTEQIGLRAAKLKEINAYTAKHQNQVPCPDP